MKKAASAFIAILLATGLAILSACNSTVPSTQPGEGVASPNNSIPDISIPDESSEASVPDESSDLVIENDVSANMGDTVDVPPLGTPTKLIPILEFGFGDGDYELGYSAPDEYGFTTGPNGLCVNGNDILVNDHVNGRLLVYRDGKLIDKVDVSEYRASLMCEMTDNYYYILDEYGSFAYRIDRKTKEFLPIEFESHDCAEDNDYTWSFRFETFGDDLYIYGFNVDDKKICNLIDGVKGNPASLPKKPDIVASENSYTLNTCDGQQKKLELAYETAQLHVLTTVKTNKDSSASFISQTLKHKNKNIAYFNAYYKYSADGTVIGRYVQPLWNDSYKPLWSTSFGSTDFEMAITDDGDLLVVNGDDEHVGIYKVEFGMDEFPFDISDEEIETQGDLHNVQSPNLNETNASASEDMTYHPRVTRENADITHRKEKEISK